MEIKVIMRVCNYTTMTLISKTKESTIPLFSLLYPFHFLRFYQTPPYFVVVLSSSCRVDNQRLKLLSTWMQWTKLRTHGTCLSPTPGLYKTHAWRHGEAALRTWRRLRMLCLFGPRPTPSRSLENTLPMESLRRPRRSCLSRATATDHIMNQQIQDLVLFELLHNKPNAGLADEN